MGSTFQATRNQIIEAALRKVSSNDSGDAVPPHEIADADLALALVIKSWMVDVDLWKRAEYIIPIVPGKNRYQLGPTAEDRAGPLIREFTVSTGYAGAGVLALTAADLTGVTVGDYVGLALDARSVHWATITALNTPSPGNVTMSSDPGTAAAIGNKGYFFAATGNRPQKLLYVNRVNFDLQSIPVGIISRREYSELAAPRNTGTPVQVHYDPQLGNGILHVWPTGDTNYTHFSAVAHLPLNDLDTASGLPDMPVEWHRALVWGLAWDLLDEYDVDVYKAQRIEAKAKYLYQQVVDYDVGEATIAFSPSEQKWG